MEGYAVMSVVVYLERKKQNFFEGKEQPVTKMIPFFLLNSIFTMIPFFFTKFNIYNKG